MERLSLSILERPSCECSLNRLRRHPIPWTPLIRTIRSPTRPRQPTTLRRVWTRSRVESRSLSCSLSRTWPSLLLAVRRKNCCLLRRTRPLAALTSRRTRTCPPLRPLSPVTPTRQAGLRPNVPLTSSRRPTTPWTAACVTPRKATPTPCIQSLPCEVTRLPLQQLTSLRRKVTPLLTTVAPTLLPVLRSSLKKLRKWVLSLMKPLPRWTILPLTSSPNWPLLLPSSVSVLEQWKSSAPCPLNTLASSFSVVVTAPTTLRTDWNTHTAQPKTWVKPQPVC